MVTVLLVWTLYEMLQLETISRETRHYIAGKRTLYREILEIISREAGHFIAGNWTLYIAGKMTLYNGN